MVDNAGTRRHILAVLTDGLAQGLMERSSEGFRKLAWSNFLFFLVLLEKQTFHDIRSTGTYDTFRPHIAADAYMAVLDTWLEVYVANKDPLQHFNCHVSHGTISTPIEVRQSTGSVNGTNGGARSDVLDGSVLTVTRSAPAAVVVHWVQQLLVPARSHRCTAGRPGGGL